MSSTRWRQNCARPEAAFAFWIVILVLASNQFGEFCIAQTLQIEGSVRDAASGTSLSNVNISVLGKPIGTASNAQGKFSINAILSHQDTVVFSHVGYQPLKLMVAELLTHGTVSLMPKPVVLGGIQIEAIKESPMAKELPASVSQVPLDLVTAQAAVDLGDLIHRDASVKIDETAAGGKFVSIRGSNPDEVLVIYDGIRLNSVGKNTFDLAQIDLANLEKVELIKGSNTVLFGEGAFGGVLNVVPRKLTEYRISTVQRVGTYHAKELAINLYKTVGQFASAYAFSLHDMERQFGETQTPQSNQSNFHTLWGSYRWRENKLEARYLNYRSDFDDPLLLSTTEDKNSIVSLVYDGSFWYLKNFKLSAIWKRLDENIQRHGVANQNEELDDVNDRSTVFRMEKQNRWGDVSLTLSYEHVRNHFDARLNRVAQLQSQPSFAQTSMRRNQDGFFAILKNRLDLERPHFKYLDWDLSFRIDWIETSRTTRRTDLLDEISTGSGRRPHLTYKVGMNAVGQFNGMKYKAFVLNGANVKLPTVQQLFYLDMQPRVENNNVLQLNIEQNIGTEAGLQVTTDLPSLPTFLRLRRIEFDFAIFRNGYLEKITEAAQKGASPRPFNTKLATTTGFESRLSLGVLNGLVDWESAFLILNVSDPRVFRFKPEEKVTSDLWLRRGRTTANCHFFYEGKQAALILSENLGFAELLPPRWDIDFSIQRTITIKRITGFLNFAVRNVRNSGRSELSGFFLQDRRWYASIGAQL